VASGEVCAHGLEASPEHVVGASLASKEEVIRATEILHQIITRAAAVDIRAQSVAQVIAALSAQEPVVACPPGQTTEIITVAPALEQVVASTTANPVIASLTIALVGSAVEYEHVGSLPAADEIVSSKALNDVVPPSSDDYV
jgi:hypothetical protein